MSPFQILPVENTKWDRDQVSTCLITAMYPDDYYRAIYPSNPLPDLIRYASLRLGANLQNTKAWFLKVVELPEGDPAGGTSREIIAYARYILPPLVLSKLEKEFPRKSLSQEEKVQYEREAEEGSDGVGMPKGINALLLEVVEPVMAKAREAFPAGEVIILDMLATHPTHQHKGAASALVKWGTALADTEGLRACLEATDGNEGFYRTFGFRKVSEGRHDLRPWGGKRVYTHVFMVREPKVVVGEI